MPGYTEILTHYPPRFSNEAPYCIVERGGTKLICGSGYETGFYMPGECPDMRLIQEIYALKPDPKNRQIDECSVLAFCNLFGLLEHEKYEMEQLDLPPGFAIVKDETGFHQLTLDDDDRIPWVISEARLETVRYWLLKLHSALELIRNSAASRLRLFSDILAPDYEEEQDLVNILRRVTRGLNIMPVARENAFDEVGLSLELSFPTLRHFAGYQLFLVAAQERGIKACDNCGGLFIPTRKSQRFCPDPNGTKGQHSSCQNSYNQRAHRQRAAERIAKK